MTMRQRKVEGVGINDADYPVVTSKCPYYRVWQSMLKRCYNQKFLLKNPTYLGCSVVPEWHLFSTFKHWMMLQDWVNKELDKDLLFPGNKVYGPSTCFFVSHQINGLLATQPKLRGELPLGVTKHGNRFKVNFKKNRKTVHIGVFESVVEAQRAYATHKSNWIIQLSQSVSCQKTKHVLLMAASDIKRSVP